MVLTCFVLRVQPTVPFLFLFFVLPVILVSHFCSICAQPLVKFQQRKTFVSPPLSWSHGRSCSLKLLYVMLKNS
jgi:hypothetical protein